MKRLSRALGSIALTIASSQVLSHNLWIEAESGAEYNPLVVKADLEASNRIYLASWKYPDNSANRGRVSFEIYAPAPGYYTLWARTRIPFTGIQPFKLSFGSGDVFDESQWLSWAPDTRAAAELNRWSWSSAGNSTYLEEGLNQIHLVVRDGGPGVHLDKLLLTDDDSFEPSGLGEPEVAPVIENDYKAEVVRRHGQLRVENGKLLDQQARPIQLRGISSHGLQWFELIEQQTIPAVAEFFKADVIRLAAYVEEFAPTDPRDFWGGYMADPAYMLGKVEAAIDDAIAAGVYVIVDWHIHSIPQDYTQQALEFFDTIAQRYGHLPNIIYEICNEPTAVTWSGGIKPYADKIIPAIRRHDPDNVIIVGTPNWSQDVDAAALDPLSHANVMYAFHYYAGTHDFNTMRAKLQTALDAGLAVFVSEWGASDVGTTTVNLDAASVWMDHINELGLSWVNWSLGNKDETSSILKPTAPLAGPWSDADLTEVGRWLKPYLLEPRNTTTPGDNPTPDPEPLLATQIDDDSIVLKWLATGTDVRCFEVYRDTDANPDGRVKIAVVDKDTHVFEDASASFDVPYYYWVKIISNDLSSVSTLAVPATLPRPLAAVPVSGALIRLRSKLSNKTLVVNGDSRDSNAGLTQSGSSAARSQNWLIYGGQNDQFHLLNTNSFRCLDVPFGTPAGGTAMQQWWCNGQARQTWEFIAQANGYYALKNIASGKCLDVASASNDDGARIVQWDCHFFDNQQWRLEVVTASTSAGG